MTIQHRAWGSREVRAFVRVAILTVASTTVAGASRAEPIAGARSLYLLRCAGCHGIQGVSVPTAIPTLRGRAGVFLCSEAGRDFVLRLPNIQMALIRDDGDLAAVMNFVAFDLGGGSAPSNAPPFTAGEVAASRDRPLETQTIRSRRDGLIRQAGACAAPYGDAVR